MKRFVTKMILVVGLVGGLLTVAGCKNPASSNNDNPPPVGGTKNLTVENCAEYTLTLKEAAPATEFAYLLQVDNDGSQDADGLKIKITDLKLQIKVGDKEPVVKTFAEIEMIPDEYSAPAFSKTSKRTVIGIDDAIVTDTVVKVKVLSATIDNKEKASSIIFALQREGGDYQFFGIDNESLWKPAFAE